MSRSDDLRVDVIRCQMESAPSNAVNYELFVKTRSVGAVADLRAMYGIRHSHYYVTHDFGVLSWELSSIAYRERNDYQNFKVDYTRIFDGQTSEPADGLTIDLPVRGITGPINLVQVGVKPDLTVHVRMPEHACYERELSFALKLRLAPKSPTP